MLTITDIDASDNREKLIAGCAEVVRACGFDAMAEQFINEPAARSEIGRIIEKDITGLVGLERAAEWVDMLDAVLRAGKESSND